MKNSLSLEVQDGAPRTSATGGLLPSLTKLVPLDPEGPRTRAAPHANLKASAYNLPGMESWAGRPQDMSPTGTRKSFREGWWEPSHSPGRKQQALTGLVALRRLWFPLRDAGNTLAPEMFLQQLTNAKQSSSRLTTQH